MSPPDPTHKLRIALGVLFTAAGVAHLVVPGMFGQMVPGYLADYRTLVRQARLGVAVALAALASVVLGVVCFLLTIAVGGAAVPSALLAATFTASGLMFAGVAAVAVQLGSDARSANSIAIAALGVCFVARGFIDSIKAPAWASWASPFGWLEHISPATDNNPWPLLAAGALAFALVVAGFALDGRRDYGAGIIAPRPGPERAGAVASIWGLAVRLNRGSVITWFVAFAGLGVVFGYLATSITDLLADNPALGSVFAANGGAALNLTFAFLVTILQLIGLIAAIAGVQTVNRIILEENNFRVEPLLAAALRRPTYLASNLLVAYLAPAACLLIGTTVIATVAAAAGTGVAFGDVLAQGAVTIPAVWPLVAVSAAVVGARPALRMAGWLGVIAAFGLTILGPTFKLPNWALSISPLHHVPNITAPDLNWTGLIAVGAVFLALNVVAFVGFRRRDVT
jgi:ABC-2 type transport system permease protein